MAVNEAESNWIQVTPSGFAWEKDALEYLRAKLPAGEVYSAWANFTFMTSTGRSYEVDTLVMTPKGLFLVEIKSRPGRIGGDQGTWKWYQDGGRTVSGDNPLPLANEKAKALKGMLERTKVGQAAAKRGKRIPWVEELAFMSHETNALQLPPEFSTKVFARDTDGGPGIWHGLTHIPSQDFHRTGRRIDRPTAALIREAMDEIGIRHSMRSVHFGDYKLDKLVASGPGYQDYVAVHTTIESKRRVRVYAPTDQVTDAEAEVIERAARREARILEGILHPGIVRATDFMRHERGPSVIYEWIPDAMRLDRYVDQHGAQLDLRARITLVRRIAEAVRYAHRHGIVHRSLNPQAVLIDSADGNDPQPKIIDWQVAFDAGAETNVTRGLTSHVGQLVDEPAQCYMAPEAVRADEHLGQQVDVFGVGAVAFHIFTGLTPASSPLELADRVRGTGLDLASHIDGVPEQLREAIMFATTGDLAVRWASMEEFLAELSKAEAQLATKDSGAVVADPATAMPGDFLGDDLLVVDRLGSGATAHALLVESEQDGTAVVKVARGPEHDERIRREADTLHGLSHQGIVQLRRRLTIQGREAFLMTAAGPETIGARIRREGRPGADLLDRWGTDLLQTVVYLEQVKASHRDIKPDNIGVWEQPGSRELHLVLFDFSLAGTDATNIRAGTPPYLDPFLQDPSRRVWDQHGERFAAAMTLHELASGQLPVWGSDGSDPFQIDVEVTIDPDLFDPSLAPHLTEFLQTALARDVSKRFDTSEEMLLAWRAAFDAAGATITSEHPDLASPEEVAASAGRADALAALGIAPRIVDLYARLGADTVDDVLTVDIARINALRGTGNQVRRDALKLYRALRERFPVDDVAPTDDADDDAVVRSIDLLVRRVVPDSRKTEFDQTLVIRALLGLHVGDVERGKSTRRRTWPTPEGVAEAAGLELDDVQDRIDRSRRHWSTRAAIKALRDDIANLLELSGGVMSVDELASAVLAQRGSTQVEPRRSMDASAVAHAAVEAELAVKEPRWQLRRGEDAPTLIALDGGIDALELAAWGHQLGERVDELLAEGDVVLRVDAIDQLRLIDTAVGTVPLSDARLLSLAAAASRTGALSSRAELYRVGLPAKRALELARGALLGARAALTVDDVASRVHGRFVDAEPLPERPALDQLLTETGIDLVWNSEAKAYTSLSTDTANSITTSYTRFATNVAGAPDPHDPEVAQAQEFEDRLHRSENDGGFLCLKVRPDRYVETLDELHRFAEGQIDLSARLIDLMVDVASVRGAQWNAVLAADEAGPEGPHWVRLTTIAEAAASLLEAELLAAEGLVIGHSPGLLARYEQLPMIERIRDTAGSANASLTALWLVIPQDASTQRPVLDGAAIPVIGPQHHAVVPEPWIRNRHRSRAPIGSTA